MRTIAKPILCAAIITELLFLAACSGQTLSASQFRSRLNALCAKEVAFNQSVPRLRAIKHLSLIQTEALVEKQSAQLNADFLSLMPPASLAAARQALIADSNYSKPARTPRLVTPATVKSLVPHYRKLEHDYAVLGATGCEKAEAQGITALEKDAHPAP